MARADGCIVKAGGRVVKNVSGYDLARMMCGSLGALAVITQATFKLAPIAPASRTVVIDANGAEEAVRLALAVAAAPLAPSAIDLQVPGTRVLVRFESAEAAADRQAAAVESLCRVESARASIVAGSDEQRLWREHERVVWNDDGDALVLKVSVLPTDAGAFVEDALRIGAPHGVEIAAIGRAALGVLYLKVRAAEGRARAGHYKRTVETLRRLAVGRNGHAIVIAAPPEIGSELDAWGDLGTARPVMRAVKASFDPRGILCDRFGF